MAYRGTRPFRCTVLTSWGAVHTSAHARMELALDRARLNRGHWTVVWHADACPFKQKIGG